MKYIRIILSSLLVVVGLLLFVNFASSFFFKSSLFNAYIVQSGSMEPAIKTGSLVISLPSQNYSQNDVITYKDGKKLVTHRIEVKLFPKGPDSTPIYMTSGDANKDFDRIKLSQDQIVGKVLFSVPYLGYAADFAKTPKGFILFVVIPATIIVYEELKFLFNSIISRIRERFKKNGLNNFTSIGINSKLIAVIPIFGAIIVFVGLTNSFFLDSEISTQNVMQASVFTTPTPTPTPPIAQTLIINEILPVSSCVDAHKDTNWIELWNGTSGDVDLKSFKLSDGTNITDLVNSNTTLSSHAFALIAKDGSIFNKGTDKGNKCYPDNNAITPNLGNNAPVSLTTGILRLLAADGTTVLDRVEFGASNSGVLQTLPDQSIERIQLGFDTAPGDTFHASDLLVQCTPTPGTWVAPTGHCNVVISEVQIATPSAITSDFVELYNPTSSSVNLNNYKLVKRTSSGTTDSSLISFTISHNIPAHGFFLWASTDGGYSAQIGADASSSANLAADNSVALKLNDGTVVDAVAWGAPAGIPLVETTPFATNPAAGKSIERKAYSTSTQSTMEGGVDSTHGNEFDSNNNSTDFILRNVSQPQNSASATEIP